jgi:hypothetical protein
VRAIHLGALALWVLAWAAGLGAVLRARRSGRPEDELAARRRVRAVVVLEHAALAVALVSGLLLMNVYGLPLGRHRWLDLKLGLVAFLLLPLEGMHAWVNHVWIARGLRQAQALAFPRDLARGIALDDMVRTLSAVLLGAALPLLVWLSVREPF